MPRRCPAAARFIVLYDGHGSTRVLLGVGDVQRFAYDAYGNLLTGPGLTLAADTLTSLLYSGEQTDRTGLQYLRARYYDPATGHFNRLDPFAGNVEDPQSLHKYLYAHANPVSNTDPTGMFIGLGAAIGAAAFLAPGPGDYIVSALQNLVSAYAVNLEWDVVSFGA